MSRKRVRYSDEFIAGALLMLEAAGYPHKRGALTQVASHLDMKYQTLKRWATGTRSPVPQKTVQEKKFDVIAAIDSELNAIFSAMGETRETASYRDLATAAGILLDKRQILTGGATANENHRILVQYVDRDHNTAS